MGNQPPRFLQTAARQAVRAAPRWPWALGCVALAALVCLQVLLADRARLAADPQWRPRLQTLCAALRCELPAWRQPQAFRVLAREIRPHPQRPGVLLLTATFRNDAAYAQAWPRLEVNLGDLDGQSLGLRRFAPREYLGAEPTSSRIEPGQAANASLAIVAPGKRALAFGLDFH